MFSFISRYAAAALMILAASMAQGQIITDRPTQSFSPFVVPQGGFQAEAGFVSERPDAGEDFYNVTYTNLLLRYAVVEWAEVRLVQNYLGERGGVGAINGFSGTTIGTKIHLNHEQGVLPQMGIIAGYTFENGDPAFRLEDPVKDIRVSFQHTLSDRFSLGYNIGTFWMGDDPVTYLYTLVLGLSATDKLGLFVEPYGFFARNTPADNRFNAGATYLLSDDYQVDVSFGNAMSKRAPDYFISFGIAGLF